MFQSTLSSQSTPILQPKIEKRVDEAQSNHDMIQPSEVTHPSSCSMTSCPCTVTLTESLSDKLKTKVAEDMDDTPLQLKRSPFKPTKYSSTIVDTSPSTVIDFKKENKNNRHKPDHKQGTTPSDKVIQKYTEVVSEQSNDANKKNDKNKHANNKPIVSEQSNKRNITKVTDDKRKPVNTQDKNKEPPKVQKNKFEVADLLKLGTLGIKKLAPMIEQMTGSLIRRQEQTKQSTTTVKPVSKITPYVVNKRVDDFPAERKPTQGGQFPIYIPVDEKDIDTAESQNIFYNSTLQQNLAWHNVKNSRNNLAFGKPIHESPLLNGGIPISPGEIITTNSDVIVGKPAVGGPNIGHLNKPDFKTGQQNFHVDSHSSSSNLQDVRTNPPQRGQGIKQIPIIRGDDTYDLRPPMMSMPRPPPPRLPNENINKPQNSHAPGVGPFNNQNQKNIPLTQSNNNVRPDHPKPENVNFNNQQSPNGNNGHYKPHNMLVDHVSGSIHSTDTILENHGRPAFLDYIPALDSPASYQNYIKNNLITRKTQDENNHLNNLDKNKPQTPRLPQQENKFNFINTASIPNKKIKDAPEPILLNDLVQKTTMKPFLVDIQPSRVANVIIPHGNSATALIFAGSSEPHKNGEYIDDPLPYPEPGYFGSFSIDAPHLTSVHVGGSIPFNQGNGPVKHNPDPQVVNHSVSGLVKDVKPPPGQRWKYEDSQKQTFQNYLNRLKIPPPISNQESNMNSGPHFVLKKPENFNTIEFAHNHNSPPPIRNLNFKGPSTTARPPNDYDIDLAVPPPPPPTVQVKFESNVGVVNSNFNNGGNRPHFNGAMHQPEASVKHPTFVQNNQLPKAPPKITSEVYFASTASNGNDYGQKLKPFTVNIPSQQNFNQRPVMNPSPNLHESTRVSFENNKFINTFEGGLVTLNAGSKVNIPNIPNSGVPTYNVRIPNAPTSNTHYSVPQNGGLITLNAGTSVVGPNLPEQTISGTSLPGNQQQIHKKPQFNSHNVKEFHSHEGESTGISIGTNMAIKVEPQVIQEYNPGVRYGMGSVSTADFTPHEKGPEIIIGGNSWKAGSLNDDDDNNGNIGGIPDNVQNGNQKVHVVHASSMNTNNYNNFIQNQKRPVSNIYNISGVVNSHANFPMSRENVTNYDRYASNQNSKPIIQINSFRPLYGEDNEKPYGTNTQNNRFKFEESYYTKNQSNVQRPIVIQPVSARPTPDKFSIHYATTVKEPQKSESSNKVNTAVPNTPRPEKKPAQVQQSNIKIESTTHKLIPLNFDFESERYGDSNKNTVYGQKLHSVGHPPTNFNWQQNSKPILNPKDKHVPDFKGIGEYMAPPPLTTPPYNPAYIPSNYNINRQPVYDIPSRDHQMNKVTFNQTKPKPPPSTTTPSYATNNLYKTIDEKYNQNNIAQASVKIPVLTSTPQTLTNEVTINFRPLKNTSRPNEEILVSSENDYIRYGSDKRKPSFNADDNTGSQTEEPFDANKYKDITIVTLPGSKLTTKPTYNVMPFSQMAPRPFSVSDNTRTTTVNKVNNDVQKPRPFHKPVVDDSNRLSLNIGEVPAKPIVPIVVANITENIISITTPRPTSLRPQLSVKNNTIAYKNEYTNSITNAPRNTTVESSTNTLPTFTMSEKINESSVIPNMSPPPPAIDFNFKPTPDDDTIMGMSPPPKTPAPKLPTKEYTKYSDISTYRPSYNSPKNPYKRPADYYRITSRPFSRYTTPSTPSNRHKVTSGTTITRIVLPSRTPIPPWKNPIRIETKPDSNRPQVPFTRTHSTLNTIINTTPLDNMGPEIMHPDTYPEENSRMNLASIINSDPIIPDKVSKPIIYPTFVQSSQSHSSSVTPSVIKYESSIIQGSENYWDENAIKKTETLKVVPITNIDNHASKSTETLTHKFTIPTMQTSYSNIEREITLKPIHHAGNEIIQSDDDILDRMTDPVTAITYTTTLERPVSTVMTTRFVTLTHTLTVTQTKTSVVSPVVGSTTQTLTLTDTQTSTVVDVVTEIHTLVQPTTIVETITKHVSVTTLPDWETKYPKVPIEPTRMRDIPYKTRATLKLDDVTINSEEEDFIITPDNSTMDDMDTSHQEDNDTFFVVMNKSQNGGSSSGTHPVLTMDNSDSGEATRNEETGNDGVAHVLLGEILLAGTPYLETPDAISPTGNDFILKLL